MAGAPPEPYKGGNYYGKRDNQRSNTNHAGGD